MGDPTHIIELIDRILEETEDQPELQQKIFDLRDALLAAQQSVQQYNLKIKTLEETIRQLKSPAHRIGTVLGPGNDDLVRLNVGGTEYQAAVSPEILENGALEVGDQVAVNEGFVAILKLPKPEQGPIARVVTRLNDGHWMVSGGTGNSEFMVQVCDALKEENFREGDEIILDPTQRVILKGLPKREQKLVVEDEFVSVTWEQVGGQEDVIKEVRKVIEYPILHQEILDKMEYRMPKGFLFYGPPGCGKTLIGKAILSDIVAKLQEQDSSLKDLQGRFIHVKGPEILNMWLGESERKVREIFKKARDYREKGQLPFVFIDEAESVLGTRQAMRVNNISNTLVPMFCAEMDGIQSVRDMVVILATNRPDLIDPAILRPGRIDRKIKVSRPDRAGCEDILKVYLKKELPIEGDSLDALIQPFLDTLFSTASAQEALLLTLRNGEFRKLFWKDFISGAILESIVLRAKERAVERAIAGEPLMMKGDDLLQALEHEFVENNVLPADSNMEDWLQLLDFDPKNVVRVRRPKDSDQAAHQTMSRSII
ncbi:AAA family ATPase [Nitrospina watsonii]|uniref:Bacterial proteasome-activating AAA-ATPase (PAN) n=1 Tax=Nitrospina watsonii TaxID=1323948 RepID=A0ABN8W450_9BACT|nr:AAA family ATPase [Nitrospina watsonii]CAI2719664.1 Bacterial proteasome-activating AAA-ATPase (PAN) [Nitrospina watsonii]